MTVGYNQPILSSMDPLITEIEAFCKRHNMSKWDFGENAMGDRPFVKQLEQGRDIRFSTAAKVRAYMAGYSADQAA